MIKRIVRLEPENCDKGSLEWPSIISYWLETNLSYILDAIEDEWDELGIVRLESENCDIGSLEWPSIISYRLETNLSYILDTIEDELGELGIG